MKKVHFRLFGWALGVVVMLAIAFRVATVPSLTVVKNQSNQTALNATDNASVAKAKQNFSKLPMAFEQNQGQTDPQVKFIARGPGYTAFLTEDEAVLKLKASKTNEAVMRMHMVGANRTAKIQPEDQLPGKNNYLIGNDRSKWHTNVATFSKVRYQDVYPGIDVVYQGDQGRFRYDFVVKPGASPSSIRMALDGPEKLTVDKDGNLAMSMAGKTLHHLKPYTYQEIGGVRTEVASNYALRDGRVTFEVAGYNASEPLIIDPTVQFSDLIGGDFNDMISGVSILTSATVASGSNGVYMTGTTVSSNFPTKSPLGSPAAGGSNSGQSDVFVLKLGYISAGTINPSIVYGTYLGGAQNDLGNAIALNSDGTVVIAGQTYSGDFPITAGSNPITITNTNAAFVSKLNAAGAALTFSVLLDGPTNDIATGVALTSTGAPCVSGYSDSNPFLGFTSNGSYDAFVACLNASSGAVTSKVLYGGSGADFARGIAINPVNNNMWIVGDTTSPNLTVTNSSTLTSLVAAPAGRNAFAAMFTLTGTTLSSSPASATYFGGAGIEFGNGVATDAVSRAYITGSTTSANLATTGALQPALSGTQAAYAAIIDPNVGVSQPTSVYVTYYNSASTNAVTVGNAIATDNSPVSTTPVQYSQMYIAGQTYCATSVPAVTGGGASGACANALPMNSPVTAGQPAFANNPTALAGNGIGPFSGTANVNTGDQDAFAVRINPNIVVDQAAPAVQLIAQLNMASYVYTNSGAGVDSAKPADFGSAIAVSGGNDRTVAMGGWTYSQVKTVGSTTNNGWGTANALSPGANIGGSGWIPNGPVGSSDGWVGQWNVDDVQVVTAPLNTPATNTLVYTISDADGAPSNTPAGCSIVNVVNNVMTQQPVASPCPSQQFNVVLGNNPILNPVFTLVGGPPVLIHYDRILTGTQTWLNTPTLDVLTGQGHVTINTANAANLPEGTYTAFFLVSATNPIPDNQYATVVVTLIKRPSIWWSPNALNTAAGSGVISAGTYTSGGTFPLGGLASGSVTNLPVDGLATGGTATANQSGIATVTTPLVSGAGSSTTGVAGSTCILTPVGGTGAQITATITTGGSLTGATLVINSAGYGLSSAPTTATVTSGTATCSGSVSITSTLGAPAFGGAGTCILSFTGGGGSGALGQVTLAAGGVLAAASPVSVVAAGSGYTSVPTSATLSNGTATCSGTATVAAATLTGLPVGTIGQTCVVSNFNGTGSGAQATVSFIAPNTLGSTMTVTSAGSGYTAAPTTATLSSGSGNCGPGTAVNVSTTTTSSNTAGQTCLLSGFNGGGTGATATVTFGAGGTLASGSALTITSGGNGYITPPTTASLSSGTGTCSGTANVSTLLTGLYNSSTGVLSVSNTAVNFAAVGSTLTYNFTQNLPLNPDPPQINFNLHTEDYINLFGSPDPLNLAGGAINFTATYGQGAANWLYVANGTNCSNGASLLSATPVPLQILFNGDGNPIPAGGSAGTAGTNDNGFTLNFCTTPAELNLVPGVYTATVTATEVSDPSGTTFPPNTRPAKDSPQSFTVTLNVTDLTQRIQLTPNNTPAVYSNTPIQLFSTVANSNCPGAAGNPPVCVADVAPFNTTSSGSVLWSLPGAGGVNPFLAGGCVQGAAVVSSAAGTITPFGFATPSPGPGAQMVYTPPAAITTASTVTIFSCRPNPGFAVDPSLAQISLNLTPPAMTITATPGTVNSGATVGAAGTTSLITVTPNSLVTFGALTPLGFTLSPTAGTITNLATNAATGVTTATYNAPTGLASSTVVTITALVAAEAPSGPSATTTITVNPGSAVTISPKAVTIYPDAPAPANSQPFTAQIVNAPGVSPTFSLSAGGGAGPACPAASLGTITISGLYTAPASIATQCTVTVTATAVDPDGTKTDTAVITLVPPATVALSPSAAITLYGTQSGVPVSQTSATFTVTTANPATGQISISLSVTHSGAGVAGTLSANFCLAPFAACSVTYVAPAGPLPATGGGTDTVNASIVAQDGTKTATTPVVITLSGPSTLALAANPTSRMANQTSTITATSTNPAGTAAVTYSQPAAGGPTPCPASQPFGTVSPTSGASTTYTAPQSIQASGCTVTVTGTWSAPDSTRTATTVITLLGISSVSVSANPTNLYAGQTSSVSASIGDGAAAPVFNFTLTGAGSLSATSCTASGSSPCSVTYTAPSPINVTSTASIGVSTTDPVLGTGTRLHRRSSLCSRRLRFPSSRPRRARSIRTLRRAAPFPTPLRSLPRYPTPRPRA